MAVMTRLQLVEIVQKLKYLDWEFYIGEFRERSVYEGPVPAIDQEPPPPVGYYLQMRFSAPDSQTGKIERQHCRKWFISRFACRQEVLVTRYT